MKMESELDAIEAEAVALQAAGEPGKGATIDNETGKPEPEPEPQPPEAFDMTHAMIVGVIKSSLIKYPGGEIAGKVWESESFKTAMLPVLKKYNLTVFNLPVELVLLGAIFMMAKESSDIIKAASAKEQSDAAKD